MPYLPGYGFKDSSGNPIVDAVGAFIQEQSENAVGLIDDVREIVRMLAMSGAWAPLTIGEALAEALEKITGQIPPETTLADYVASIYDFTRPLNAVSSNIPHQLTDLQDYLEGQIGLVRYDNANPHNATVQDVLDRLDLPVELPTVPPAGYGGDAPTVAQIWGHVLNDVPGGLATADEAVGAAWRLSRFLSLYGATPVYEAPHFVVNYATAAGGAVATGFQGVYPDYTDIRADDTVLSWLQRTATPARTWEVNAASGLVLSYTNLSNEYHTSLVCTLTDAELLQLGGFGSSPVVGSENLPPVWPGVANVVLGAPVAITSNLTVAGPLDGILVTVTTAPIKLSEVVIGGVSYWYRVGEVTFVSDNGQAEPFQYLGFEDAIYTPRFMKRAASAKLRVQGGAEGTVTPWTLAV